MVNVSGIRATATTPAVGTAGTIAPIQPVAAVAARKPSPDRQFDASGTGRAGGVAALLLQQGGSPASVTTAMGDESATVPRPNLDALNRVLAHYEAQSVAAARLKP